MTNAANRSLVLASSKRPVARLKVIGGCSVIGLGYPASSARDMSSTAKVLNGPISGTNQTESLKGGARFPGE